MDVITDSTVISCLLLVSGQWIVDVRTAKSIMVELDEVYDTTHDVIKHE